MPQRNRGFTLLEILIGFFILSAAGLVFFIIIRSSTKESGFGANHFTALMLAQKVSEDIMEEFAFNPHGDAALDLHHAPGPRVPIADGLSVFFMALEDRRAPWGRIDSMHDGGIDTSVEPLYGQVQGFSLGISARSEGFQGFQAEKENLQEIRLDISWKGSSGAGKAEKAFFVFAPRQPRAFVDPGVGINYAVLGLPGIVRSLLPPGTPTTQPLSAAISALGSEETILTELAAMIAISERYFQAPQAKTLKQQEEHIQTRLLAPLQKKRWVRPARTPCPQQL